MDKLPNNCSLCLISGGARSGKSRAALSLARQVGEQRLFVATAQAFDDEMTSRIDAHRMERPDFSTFEKPFDLRETFPSDKIWDVILIDCLTLWLSNLLLSEFSDAAAEESVYEDLRHFSNFTKKIILVSNEVGLGIVPEHALARRFRDLNGRLQQGIARMSDEVYFAVMGTVIPLHSFPKVT